MWVSEQQKRHPKTEPGDTVGTRSPAVTSLSPFSLKELESQVWCLEKEAAELKEAVEQQKVKNNVSAEGRVYEASVCRKPTPNPLGRDPAASACPIVLLLAGSVLISGALGKASCPLGSRTFPGLTPIGWAWALYPSVEPPPPLPARDGIGMSLLVWCGSHGHLGVGRLASGEGVWGTLAATSLPGCPTCSSLGSPHTDLPGPGMARASCGVSGGRSLFSEEPG